MYINGVATEVPTGQLDMKGMFGEQDLLLFHSSGIQVSNTSVSSSLQPGESYFLVHRILTHYQPLSKSRFETELTVF